MSTALVPVRENRKSRGGPAIDYLPPHAEDAERGVLSCALQDPSVVESVQERIKAWGVLVFYSLRHQRVWECLLELRTADAPIDLITLSTALRDAAQLEAVGGLTYLNEIVDSAPSAANWAYYLDIVCEKYLLRRVVAQCSEVLSRVRDEPGEVTSFIAQYQEQVITLVEEHAPSRMVPQQERMHRLVDMLENRHRGKQEITGLRTPFWYLNNMTAGLQKAELFLVAARPSTGKTAFGIDVSIGALAQQIPVLFFSIEMSADQIDLRMLGNIARVNGMKLRNGFWREDAGPRLTESVGKMSRWPLYLDDRSALTGQDVLLATRRVARECALGLVVVDYVQLMRGVRRYDKRHEEIAEASALLKQTAKECGVPVIALAQLNRDAEKDRGGRKPLLSDVKDCGSLEQDADLVGMLWEPKLNPDDAEDMKWLEHHTPDDPKEDELEWDQHFRRINLSIAKNRNGPTGDCELVFQRATARFVDAHSPKRVKETLL